jgi:hypothetical protein
MTQQENQQETPETEEKVTSKRILEEEGKSLARLDFELGRQHKHLSVDLNKKR